MNLRVEQGIALSFHVEQNTSDHSLSKLALAA
jgi:hypothetical protein